MVLIIGVIEVLIGSLTLLNNFRAMLLGVNPKSPEILFFVTVAATISVLIGIGILKFNKHAYLLLLYFSSVIILSKLLIFMHIIYLNGELENAIPASIKNIVSVIYHGSVIYCLRKKDIKRIFHISFEI